MSIFRRQHAVEPGVIFRCPAHSIQDPERGRVVEPFGTFVVTRDQFIYRSATDERSWPLEDIEGFRGDVTPGTTTARLGGGPLVLVSVRDARDLDKLKAAIHATQLFLGT